MHTVSNCGVDSASNFQLARCRRFNSEGSAVYQRSKRHGISLLHTASLSLTCLETSNSRVPRGARYPETSVTRNCSSSTSRPNVKQLYLSKIQNRLAVATCHKCRRILRPIARANRSSHRPTSISCRCGEGHRRPIEIVVKTAVFVES
jgi:hypothetical protein